MTERFLPVINGWLDELDGKTYSHVVAKHDFVGLLEGKARYPIGGFRYVGDGSINVLLGTEYEDGSLPDSGIDIDLFILQEAAGKVQSPVPAGPELKETNPKEAAGAGRIPLHLIPDGPLAHLSMAFYEGGTKYGPYNWRVAGVRASTYVAAVRRHISKWWNGDDTDPKTRVHHLANAAAGLFILIDAELQGMLTDDRPPSQDLEGLYEHLKGVQEHLFEMHKHLNPPNYTEKEHGNVTI